MEKLKQVKGITLIALIITIIVLLILAGITINLTIGQGGILTQAQNAGVKHQEAEAKQRLELALLDLQAEKKVNKEYNKDEFIDNYLTSKQMIVIGDIILVDGWQFTIDRSIPEIGIALGKGEESKNIILTARVENATDYTKANINIEVTYEEEITSIQINGQEETIPQKTDGKYIIAKEVLENGAYTILVKDLKYSYKIATVNITEISEDLEITTTEQFVAFRERVNKGATYEGKTAKLANDIDLSSVCGEGIGSWKPIGNSTNIFKGTFDGQNNEIFNMYINENENNQGLFGYSQGTIINLNLMNGKIDINNTNYNIGMLVGNNSGQIKNINIIGGNILGCYNIGGIAGTNTGTVELCINSSTINYISSGTYNGWQIGGIVGSNKGEILKSINNGTITGSHAVAGVVGTQENGKVQLCINNGAITGNTTNDGNITCGGIVGFNAYASTGDVINCYNTGKVETEQSGGHCGGIVGSSLGESGISKITNCYNVGTVSGQKYTGGIVAARASSGTETLSNNYWLSTCGATYGVGNKSINTNAEKKELSQMKNLASTLGDAYVADGKIKNSEGEWVDNKDAEGNIIYINDGYPILKWQIGE